MMIFCFLICTLISVSHDATDTPEWFPWLAGTWVQQKPNGDQRLEVWTLKDHQTLTGKGLKISGRDTTLLENLDVTFLNDQVFYIPTVPDQNEGKPVSFLLAKTDGYKLIFENAAHDFPQRIIYHLKPVHQTESLHSHQGDSILVRVESMKGDGIDFSFIRQ